MKLLELRILRGPNYWSTYRKQLIDLRIDLGQWEERPTNTIEGFSERLEALLPSLYEHRCSENRPGGFFSRVRKGTWMGHVIEHIALELQTLAGMPVGFGRTRAAGTRKGVYRVVFAYQVESAGAYAGKAAIRIAEALASGKLYDIAPDIARLEQFNREEGLGPTTVALVNEAKKRKIPWRRLNKGSLVQFGYGRNQKLICAAITSSTAGTGIQLADDKEDTRRLLADNLIPVPRGIAVSSEKELRDALRNFQFPIVIKPADSNQGNGVHLNVQSADEACRLFPSAQRFSKKVIAEDFVEGHDFRLLVINYRLEAASRRVPASVRGDGVSTIRQLIETINNDPRRGTGHEKALSRIEIDATAVQLLKKRNLELESVLPFGEILFLREAANLSAGGTATDVTDVVHPATAAIAERIARLVGLDICGIDVVAKDITQPLTRDNGAVIEVNASPGLRMHLSPTRGSGRNVAEPIVRMLFPPGTTGRIPIVAVTGTNGKTTTTRLIAHLARTAGYNVGYTTTEGIYIQDQLIYEGDCSGPSSAEIVLRDPVVDFAVLECARGGIVRSGLAFDKCDVGIITNIAEDHLGLDDIEDLRDLARVKSVVVRSVADDGHAILNADDDISYGLREDVDANVALFSIDENNERVREHCENGGIAAVTEKGYFSLWKGEWKARIARIQDVPLTFDGKAGCMIQNILPAILAAAVRGMDSKLIRKGLLSFEPGPAMTPGRMNLFHFRHCTVMLDYGHNAHGVRAMAEFILNYPANEKWGIITCPGDRRDTDLEALGFEAGKIFDQIIIRHDCDCRGRDPDSITQWLRAGIDRAAFTGQVHVVPGELDSLKFGMNQAPAGSLVVLFCEKINQALEFLKSRQTQEQEQQETN
ncbi:MAG TPA: cyanophycin synthetase [Chitinophagaceae bacterium]|nr:cyanophycin synthetase [Chitinophagaceae bacterium]